MNREEAVARYRKTLDAARSDEEYWQSFAVIQFTVALSRLLKEKKLKQKDLARMIGVEPPYITKVLHGTENFTVRQLVKFASALGAAVHIHLAKKGVTVHWEEVTPSRETVRSAVATEHHALAPPASTVADYSLKALAGHAPRASADTSTFPAAGHAASVMGSHNFPPVSAEVLYGKVIDQAAHA